MAEFALKSNYFEFNGKVNKKISGTAIGTKFAPPYSCIFLDQAETEFLETQKHKPLVCYETNKESIHFLDLNVRLSDGNISTDLYLKPADWHQFLHYTSSNPDHTKRSIVFSQTLSVRICSEKSDFIKHLEKMKSWFLIKGYPKELIESEMKKVSLCQKIGILRGANH